MWCNAICHEKQMQLRLMKVYPAYYLFFCVHINFWNKLEVKFEKKNNVLNLLENISKFLWFWKDDPALHTCIFPSTPVLSILLATFTVFPHMSYCGFWAPMTPAMTGPWLIPEKENRSVMNRWILFSYLYYLIEHQCLFWCCWWFWSIISHTMSNFLNFSWSYFLSSL